MSAQENITSLLKSLRNGNAEVLNKLFEMCYAEFRRRAQHILSREKANHTLQATALVHEAYLQLVDQKEATWQDRNHFFRVGSFIMRRVLVEHARDKKAAKRGGDATRVTLSVADNVAAELNLDTENILALDNALNELAAFDERKSKIVELRYFAGLSIKETAENLGISIATCNREWEKARAFLQQELNKNF